MLYIITEDSNSARCFWDCAAHTFRGKGNYILVDLQNDNGGNTTLNNQVYLLLPSLKSGDELFVAFDNIANTHNFNTHQFIMNTYAVCASKDVDFKFTSYYCFEELYLSYKELLNMYELSNVNKVTLKALRYVQSCLDEGKDYYLKSNINIADFIEKYKRDSGNNREHFANALLIDVTNKINGRFKITKKDNVFNTVGQCWIEDCSNIQLQLNNKHIDNMCGNCKYCCKYNDTKDKLLDLDNKSISKNSTYRLSQI
ncbi:MAG: hypothetical protein HFI21_00315 [Lachnospiraceae bacterium]|uniref:hypothetical protein n=1 Tax=Candidatus Merdisoma sp. JLR.KK011 TaxID=3114299 RepID=UPI001434573D|nr:hypothetical protein [Lachnospiraceae bacterium]GFI11125.1 hypothetical protein IMSAGC007_03598 [Lachnospiraceae bacterium]